MVSDAERTVSRDQASAWVAVYEARVLCRQQPDFNLF